MEELRSKLKKALRVAFPPPAEIRFRPGEGIVGFVISDLFRGKDDLERQDMIWAPLDEAIDAVDRREIAILIGMTLAECEARRSSQMPSRNPTR